MYLDLILINAAVLLLGSIGVLALPWSAKDQDEAAAAAAYVYHKVKSLVAPAYKRADHR